MLENGIPFNSEGWHGVTEKDIRTLEKVDEALLRSMLQCHAKVRVSTVCFFEGENSNVHHRQGKNYFRTKQLV